MNHKINLKLIATISLIILFAAFAFRSLIFGNKETKQPVVKDGCVDLSGWDLKNGDTVVLDGQWEFYWNSLLDFEDFKTEKPDAYVKVPSAWNDYKIDNKILGGFGYATYRLHVKTGIPDESVMGLKLHTFSSAYKLFINGKMVASSGEIGKSLDTEVGE